MLQLDSPAHVSERDSDWLFELTLTPSRQTELNACLGEIADRYDSVEDAAFLADLPSLARTLPKDVRHHLEAFRKQHRHKLCLLTGYELTENVGPTPQHWAETKPSKGLHDYFFVVASSLLGDVFGFSNLQDGKLVQEIFPIRSDANEQLGTGAVHLYLHTEDTSLEYRADYLGFACKRNIDRIPTDVAIPDLDALRPETKTTLRRNAFKILNDRPCLTDEQRRAGANTTAVLYDYEGATAMRYDPLYSDFSANTRAELEAMSELQSLVESAVVPICLEPGDMVFLDNHRVAHGRKAYRPRYDGTDRWLKRTQISRRLEHYAHLRVPGRWNVLP